MTPSKYLNVERIEFIVTHLCSGNCRHCSAAEARKSSSPAHVNEKAAVNAVACLAQYFNITSVMTFGGEPLLYPRITAAIHAAAKKAGIPCRQLITNGMFSKDPKAITATARDLVRAGVNDVLLSVDAFHSETLPREPVTCFAKAMHALAPECIRLSPAWVVNREHDDPYNRTTKAILAEYEAMGISSSYGNDIFLSGNAAKYLAEFYPVPGAVDLSAPCGSAPYTDPPDRVKTLSITPDGSIWACAFKIGNLLTDSLSDLIANYDPYASPLSAALLSGGVQKMLSYAAKDGIKPDLSSCRSACDVCRRICRAY